MWHAGRCAASAAVLLTGFLVACASPEERFAGYMESAAKLADEGEVENAILEYRSALRIDPNSVAANENLGDLLLRQADLSATYYLSEAVRLDPSRVDLAMRLARVLLLINRIDDAERVIDAALAAHPEAAVVQRTFAELLLYRNDPVRAHEAVLAATKLDPEDPYAWYQLGRVLQGKMRHALLTKTEQEPGIASEAIAAFEHADELAGGMVMARIERARMIGLDNNRFGAARTAFTDAVGLAKKQNDAALHFVAAESAAGFAARAKRRRFQIWAMFEMVAADPSRLDVWLDLVQVVDETSRSGVGVFKRLLSQRPDDVRAHMAYVSYLAESGQHRNAMNHLRAVIDRDLGSPLPWEQLIRFQIQRGRIANARASYVRMSDEFPDDGVTRRAEARIALAERRASDAVEILRSLTSDLDSFEHQRLLALAEYRSGNLEGAVDAINGALEKHRGFPPGAFRLKARIHHDSADWASTLRSLVALVNRGHELSPGEMLMLAKAHYGLSQPERGRAVLSDILSAKNPPVEAAVEFARREGRDDLPAATAYLTAAFAREPTNPDVLEALVALDLRAGRTSQALRKVNRVVQSGRARPATLMLRAQVLTGMGNLERAEADALRAFEADPSLAGGVELLYEIYEAQGRIDEARASFEEAEAAGVLHSGARLLLGRIYMREGNVDRARTMFEKVIREDPSATSAKNDLAYLLAQNNVDLNRALVLAEESQRANKGDADSADTLGFVYLRKGLHEAALHQFQSGLELNGDRPGILAPMLHYHLGLTLHAMDRNQEAVAAFERALALDADFPEAVDARRQLEEARRSSPESTSTS